MATHLQRQGWKINARTLRRRLRAFGLRWKRPRYAFAAPGPGPRAKKGGLVRRPKRLPAGGRLLVTDETTLRPLPPLRAAWSRRGEQAIVPTTGQNARRSLFGAVDLRSGRRVFLARAHQRRADFHAFLRRLRAGTGRAGALWLLLDNHGSHRSASSLKLAAELDVRLFWLPKQCPELNPVDHLWGGLKNRLAANRQFAAIDDQARHALAWLHRLSPTQTLRKAGLLSPRCWLREVRKTVCSPT